MIAKLIFFIFPILLVFLPIIAFRNSTPAMVRIWVRMAFDPSTRKMAANLLAMTIILLHLVYHIVFPSDWGLAISFPIMFYLFSTQRSMNLLKSIRHSRNLRWVVVIACLVMPFLPHMLSVAMTLAFVLEVSYFYPSDCLTNFYEEHAGEQDVDRKFVDAYFK